MADVILSGAVRSNLLSLQNTAKALATTQKRLATGLKVDSALDDPAAFFTASSLDARSRDISQLLDSVDLAVQTLQSASDAIDAITDLVENAQATAKQALASPSTTAITTGTVTLSGSDTLDTLNFSDGDKVTLAAGGNTTTFTVTDASTQDVDDLIAALDVNANASVALSSGNIRIEATDGGNLTLGEGGVGTNLDDLGLSAGTVNGSVNTTRSTLAAQFDSILTQIDQLAGDATFNGTNLLQSDELKVTFNEDGSSTLTVSGADLDSAGLGISASANDFQDDASIDAALSDIDGALATLKARATSFGSNLSVVETRQSFTSGLISALDTAAGNLTLADTNEEGANLLALQTRQQLSSVALSLAAASEQNVLQLF